MNEKMKETNVTGAKRGKTCVIKWLVVLVLHMIG